MRITFPHMGNIYITAKALLDDLGIDYIIPSFNSKETLNLGTKYCPEMVCLPFKLNIGNYINAYRKGADTILMAGGGGPCRFGYYCELQRQLLKDIGYEMDMIVLESPFQDMGNFINLIKKIAGGLKVYKIAKTVKNAVKIAKEVDALERLTYKIRPRELVKGSTDHEYDLFIKNIMNVHGSKEILEFIKETVNRLFQIEIATNTPVFKVVIVGEIYCSIDPYANFRINSKLGKLGVEVDRPVTISNWIIDYMLKPALCLPADTGYIKESKPYIGAMIGGHTRETIGNTVLYKKEDFDGAIQIYPLACMPEIVAEGILPAVSRDFKMPVLTLIIDEMTAEAGYMTRIEAFIDVLSKRKEIEYV